MIFCKGNHLSWYIVSIRTLKKWSLSFTGTSDGTESHINDTSGGHCADTTNNIYMKIEVYVCKKSNSTYQGNFMWSGTFQAPLNHLIQMSLVIPNYHENNSELLPKTESMRETLFQEFIWLFFLRLPGTDPEHLERNSRVTYQRYNIETISEV